MAASQSWRVSSDREVRIVEVGPRDGLQNERAMLTVEQKLELIQRLIDAGLRSIEVTSFVNSAVIPQLADADELFPRLPQGDDFDLIALVPNERGYDRALAAGVRQIEVFTGATDAFCLANIRCTVDESFGRFDPVLARAHDDGISVRGAVSVAFHCPYSGPVSPEDAIIVAERLFELGCDEVAICDTIGRATKAEVETLLAIARDRLPFGKLALHMHDTFGQATTNVRAGWEAGIRTFDAAVGGLGGCPFAPGAPGNVSTEAVAGLFASIGAETGVNVDLLRSTADWVRGLLARQANV
jgi:isopropylmalate/homocitrate/citramalate synthase